MDELILFVIGLIGEALGLKKKRSELPPVASPPPGPKPATTVASPGLRPTGTLTPRPPLMPNAPRTLARPAGDDQPLAPQEATAASFELREAQAAQSEPTPLDRRGPSRALPASSLPASTDQPLAAMFSSGNDFVRAFIMQEILQAPRALRPHVPPSAPVPLAPSAADASAP